MPRPITTPVRREPRAVRDAPPTRQLCSGRDNLSETRITQVPQTLDRVSLELRGYFLSMKHSRANVFCRRAGRPERTREERRLHGVIEHALALHDTTASALRTDAPREYTPARRRVGAVVESAWRWRACAARKCCGSKPARNPVTTLPGVRSRRTTTRRRPALVVPRDTRCLQHRAQRAD